MIAIVDESLVAKADGREWPGDRHHAIRSSPHYRTLSSAIAAIHPSLARLMDGAVLRVEHSLGGYSFSGDGAWFVNRVVSDGYRLAEEHADTSADAVRIHAATSLGEFAHAVLSGSCSGSFYAGLRGATPLGEVADLGEAGQIRQLTEAESRSLRPEREWFPIEDTDRCLVWSEDVRWSVVAPEPVKASAPTSVPNPVLVTALLALAGARDEAGRLRCPSIIWSRPSPYFCRGGGSGGGSNPNPVLAEHGLWCRCRLRDRRRQRSPTCASS